MRRTFSVFAVALAAALSLGASTAHAQVKLSTMTRATSTTGLNDSALTVVTDSATRSRAATVAQLRKALATKSWDSLLTSGRLSVTRGAGTDGMSFRAYYGAGNNTPLSVGINRANGDAWLGWNAVQSGATGDVQNYDVTGNAVRMRGTTGFTLDVAASGTAGSTIPWTNALSVGTSGAVTVPVSLTVSGASSLQAVTATTIGVGEVDLGNNQFVVGKTTGGVSKALIGVGAGNLLNIDANGLGAAFGGAVSALSYTSTAGIGSLTANSVVLDQPGTNLSRVLGLGNATGTYGAIELAVASSNASLYQNVATITSSGLSVAVGGITIPQGNSLTSNGSNLIGLNASGYLDIGGGYSGGLFPRIIGVTFAQLNAGGTNANGTIAIDTTNGRLCYYVNGNRYYLTGVSF